MYLYLLLVLVLFISESQQGVQCGKKLSNRRFKINDGIRARHNSFPWAVALVNLNSQGFPDSVICSGTLITKRHVITAAHCAVELDSKRVSVVVGDSILKPYMSIKIEKKYIHPKYLAISDVIDRAAYDIMILNLTNYVRSWYGVPICVHRWKNIAKNHLYTVYGFGNTGDNNDNKKLYYYKSKILKNRNFIISYWSSKHACSGDSGGGLTQQIGGIERLAGVVYSGNGGGLTQQTRGRERLAGVVYSVNDVNCNMDGLSMFTDMRNSFDFVCKIANVGC